MSGYPRGRRNDRRRDDRSTPAVQGKDEKEGMDSPVMKMFQAYRNELDSKHNKYERLVKASRDITIESKRIIFHLHSIGKDSLREEMMLEAKNRLENLIKYNFKGISKELEGVDRYQFLRAYSAGVQEFIEALTFYHYLDSKNLYKWEDLKKQMIYPLSTEKAEKENCEESPKEKGEDLSDEEKIENDEGTLNNTEILPVTQLFLSPWDYILGIEDLTGELMRFSINSLSSGNTDSTFQSCNFVKKMYSELLILHNTYNKEYSKKLSVLKQSLSKMENACYVIQIKGSEVPKGMLAHVVSCTNAPFTEDEGFCQ